MAQEEKLFSLLVMVISSTVTSLAPQLAPNLVAPEEVGTEPLVLNQCSVRHLARSTYLRKFKRLSDLQKSSEWTRHRRECGDSNLKCSLLGQCDGWADKDSCCQPGLTTWIWVWAPHSGGRELTQRVLTSTCMQAMASVCTHERTLSKKKNLVIKTILKFRSHFSPSPDKVCLPLPVSQVLCLQTCTTIQALQCF